MSNVKQVKPKNKEELIEIIKKECEEKGWECDLNFIDTSLITDMSALFSKKFNLENFNGDISKWNVSNVEDMFCMFYKSKFNQDISKWNVSLVWNMLGMFANSEFNQDISKWDVSNVIDMYGMFENSKFNKDISEWKIYKIKNNKNVDMFKNCNIDEIILPYWYKEYKENKEERIKQIDSYHLNKKIEQNIIVKQNKSNKI